MINIPRVTKCVYCEIKDNLNKLKIEEKNVHEKCADSYRNLLEQKRIEKQQWDELYEYIKTLTGSLDVPPRNIKRLHEIKQKKEITYKLILDAFKIAEDKIRWFMQSIRNGGNNADDINAYITIMLNSGLNAAYQQEKAKLRREEEKQKQLNQTITMDMSYSTPEINKNKNDDRDISDWL